MNEREKLLFLYTGALEGGDLETLAAILRHAAEDAELGLMIEEINAAYADEPLTTSLSDNGNKPMTTIAIPRKRANTNGLTLMVAAIATLILFSLMLFLPVSYNGVTPPPFEPQLDQRITPGNADRLNQFAVMGAGSAYDAVLSHDGETVAVATSRGIILHNVADGVSQPFGTHTSRIFNIEYSPDGSILAGVIEDDLTLWDAQTGEIVKNFEDAYLPYFVFSPDGKQILAAAFGCESGASVTIAGCQPQQQIVLLDIESGETVQIMSAERVMAPTFSPDGSLIAFAHDNNLSDNFTDVEVWRTDTIGVENASPVMTFRTVNLSNLAISPDNLYIAASSTRISLWNLETQKLVRSIITESRQTYNAAFSPDSKFVLYIDMWNDQSEYEPVLKSWDIENKRLGFPISLDGDSFSLSRFELSADRTRILTHNTSEISVWNIEDPAAPEQLLKLTEYSQNLRELTFEDDTLIITGWYDIRLWDAETQENIANLSTEGLTIGYNTSMNSEGTLAYFDGNSVKRLMYWKDGQVQATNHTFNNLRAAAFDEQDNLLVYHTTPNAFLITQIKDNRVLGEVELQASFKPAQTISYGSSMVDSMFSPDGRLLVTGICYFSPIFCETPGLLVFDTQTGEILGKMEAVNASPYAPSPLLTVEQYEGRYVVAAQACTGDEESHSPCITAWDVTPMMEGKPAEQLFSRWSSDYADIINFKFSPDLTMLALAGGNKHKVMLWDTENGTVIKELTDLFFPTDVAFNDDMTRLAVIAEGLIYLWNVE